MKECMREREKNIWMKRKLDYFFVVVGIIDLNIEEGSEKPRKNLLTQHTQIIIIHITKKSAWLARKLRGTHTRI